MNPDKILSQNSDDDVITILGPNYKKTFCVSQFREILYRAVHSAKYTYGNTLEAQGHGLYTSLERNGSSVERVYTGWFDESGVDCNLLRLGDNQWQKGIVRIRMEVEFIPDTEDDDTSNESSLDEFRENS